MVNEVKGYDVNFVYKGKSFHVNTNNLNEDKIQRLRDLGIEYYEKDAKYCFYIPEEKRVIGYASPLPEENKVSSKIVDEVSDFSWMFNNSEIKSLDLSNWNVSNGENFSCMFAYCEKLISLDVSNWDVSNGVNFGCMFYCCKSLTSLDVSKWNVSNGTNFGYMFDYCANLTSLNVSNWNVSKGRDFSYMFANCKKLTSLNLSGWKINQKANIEEMFLNCYSLKEVKVIGCDEYTISILKKQLPQNCKLVTGTQVMGAF